MTIHHRVDARADAGGMEGEESKSDPEPEVLERARPPRQYTAKYKAEILAEYERLDKAGKGALLRREGLYTSTTMSQRCDTMSHVASGLAERRADLCCR